MKTHLIEIVAVDPTSNQLASQFKELASLLAAAYVPVELEFARKNHTALDKDKFLNILQPYFQDGLDRVAWDVVEAKLNAILKQFFAEGFLKGLSANSDICANNTHYLAIARDSANNAPLGALYGWMNNTGPEKNFRVPIFGVAPKAQGEGIGKALLSSLFENIPSLQKVHLSTRATNEKALSLYHHLGFTLLPSTLENWVNLEYSANGRGSLES